MCLCSSANCSKTSFNDFPTFKRFHCEGKLLVEYTEVEPRKVKSAPGNTGVELETFCLTYRYYFGV